MSGSRAPGESHAPEPRHASPPAVERLTEAASVLLARGPGSLEVFVVRRSPNLRAFGGFHAFPGGKVAPADAALLPAHPRCATTARELFEETGALLARRADGTFPVAGPNLVQARRQLMEDPSAFGDLLRQLQLHLCADDFLPVGTFITPAFAPLRFDTAFFVAVLPAGQEVEIWPGELDEGRWTTAAAMLDAWTRGECHISPPSLVMLEAIRGRAVSELPGRLDPHFASLAAGAIPPILCSPDVQLLPLRTLGLPPSTHTNAYLVGRDPAYLLDPGPTAPDEQERLFQVLDSYSAMGGRLQAIVLTHHHPDHIGAVDACAARYRLPVWAHPLTATALAGKLAVTSLLCEGDRLDLGRAPDGRGTWHLEALHTPGHAPGHLAFYEPRYRLLLAGDVVSTLSSVVIPPPPDGDLAIYLQTLRRLQTLDCRLLLPAHGSPSTRPQRILDDAIAHRLKREEQLLEALAMGPRTIADLAVDLYRGLPPELLRFADLQVRAGLVKLRDEGRAESSGEGVDQRWQARSSS